MQKVRIFNYLAKTLRNDLFYQIDLNSSGNIDSSELAACLRGAGNGKFEAALLAREWLAQLDRNGDQRINADEFKAFFARTLDESGAGEAECTLLFFEEAAAIQVAWTQTLAKTSMQVKAERAAAEATAAAANEAATAASSCSSSEDVEALALGKDCSLATRGAYLLGLDPEAVAKQVELVKATLKEREKHRKRLAKARAAEANLDYSKTLSGTREDTVAEKAFTDLMQERDGKAELPEDPFADILRSVSTYTFIDLKATPTPNSKPKLTPNLNPSPNLSLTLILKAKPEAIQP
jgi:hypothetical protein